MQLRADSISPSLSWHHIPQFILSRSLCCCMYTSLFMYEYTWFILNNIFKCTLPILVWSGDEILIALMIMMISCFFLTLETDFYLNVGWQDRFSAEMVWAVSSLGTVPGCVCKEIFTRRHLFKSVWLLWHDQLICNFGCYLFPPAHPQMLISIQCMLRIKAKL